MTFSVYYASADFIRLFKVSSRARKKILPGPAKRTAGSAATAGLPTFTAVMGRVTRLRSEPNLLYNRVPRPNRQRSNQVIPARVLRWGTGT